jgi:hypothetical protein
MPGSDGEMHCDLEKRTAEFGAAVIASIHCGRSDE